MITKDRANQLLGSTYNVPIDGEIFTVCDEIEDGKPTVIFVNWRGKVMKDADILAVVDKMRLDHQQYGVIFAVFLGHNKKITDAVIPALLDGTGIFLLDLACNKAITDRSVETLIKHKLLYLDLSGTSITDTGAYILASSKNIRRLELKKNPNINGDGLKALLRSKIELIVTEDNVPDEEAEKLLASGELFDMDAELRRVGVKVFQHWYEYVSNDLYDFKKHYMIHIAKKSAQLDQELAESMQTEEVMPKEDYNKQKL